MASFNLTDRVAIVTGGNGGIGLGMARGLAQAGAGLMIVGRDQKKNSAAVEGPPVVDARVPWPAGRASRTSGTRRSRPMTQGGRTPMSSLMTESVIDHAGQTS
jgi:NAD(P)-dependent dehydrogenase (short-subunit alcohol dehydrogenase family)